MTLCDLSEPLVTSAGLEDVARDLIPDSDIRGFGRGFAPQFDDSMRIATHVSSRPSAAAAWKWGAGPPSSCDKRGLWYILCVIIFILTARAHTNYTATGMSPLDADRELLTRLSRAATANLISVEAAAAALRVDRKAVATRLASLARRGWLMRARRGLYFIPPLEADPDKPVVAEDPWIVAREVFAPCYIGGWSAAEHWELTEQIFRSTLVVTAANVRERTDELLGQEFRLFRVPASRIAGDLVPVWRGSERVLVSSPERTIIDSLRDPWLCGGIRHVAEILEEYAHGSRRDIRKLLSAAAAVGTGAAWKRLGYLVETLWPDGGAIAEEAKRNLTAGYARLDPAVQRRGRLLRRWRLWVNVPLERSGTYPTDDS